MILMLKKNHDLEQDWALNALSCHATRSLEVLITVIRSKMSHWGGKSCMYDLNGLLLFITLWQIFIVNCYFFIFKINIDRISVFILFIRHSGIRLNINNFVWIHIKFTSCGLAISPQPNSKLTFPESLGQRWSWKQKW